MSVSKLKGLIDELKKEKHLRSRKLNNFVTACIFTFNFTAITLPIYGIYSCSVYVKSNLIEDKIVASNNEVYYELTTFDRAFPFKDKYELTKTTDKEVERWIFYKDKKGLNYILTYDKPGIYGDYEGSDLEKAIVIEQQLILNKELKVLETIYKDK